MSAPVDVLVVLEQVAGFIGDPDWNPNAESDVEAVRAAVAELIEADTRIAEGAIRKAGGGWWMISNEDMSVLREALARVKGGAA